VTGLGLSVVHGIVMGRVMLKQLGFRAEPELFDLVLTDQTMPRYTGTALSREMKTIRPKLPVVVMSDYSESIDTENLGKYNIEAYLSKPFNTYTLGNLIREVLDRKAD
jgi:two-component system cell cycle sensor histidine kinase/response regulator CckA